MTKPKLPDVPKECDLIPARQVGRPTYYTPELAEKICNLIATSHEMSTLALCDKYEGMPPYVCINRWRMRHPEFRSMYAEAKALQAELIADNLVNMAHVESYIDADGVERTDSGNVAAKRLQIDTIKWIACKLAPRTYGDRSKIDVSVSLKHEDALKALE